MSGIYFFKNLKSVIITLVPGDLLALSFSDSLALLLRSVFSLLPGHLVALLLGDVIGHLPVLGPALLPVLGVALLPGHGGGYCLLNVVATVHRHRTTDRMTDSVAHLLGSVVGVGNRLGAAFFSGNLLAVLLGHLLALRSGLIPALLA